MEGARPWAKKCKHRCSREEVFSPSKLAAKLLLVRRAVIVQAETASKQKPKHKMAGKQQAIATTLCEEMQASNCVYKSRGAPARGIGPPLLTSIASRLTLPKLHLATFNFFFIFIGIC